MIISNKKINVNGEENTYTRNHTFDMFKKVTTKYNLKTRFLENYIAEKIKNAKNIIKVFENLEKQGYTITTVKTIFNINTPCFNTEIGGIFNGNIRTLNVLWTDEQKSADYKQNIICIIK